MGWLWVAVARSRSAPDAHRSKAEVASVTKVETAGVVEAPKPNSKRHPVAKRCFTSLGESGHAVFYEPADWATAYGVAESMSREFKPQPIAVGSGENARVEMLHMPPKAAAVAAWLKAATALLATGLTADAFRSSCTARAPNQRPMSHHSSMSAGAGCARSRGF